MTVLWRSLQIKCHHQFLENLHWFSRNNFIVPNSISGSGKCDWVLEEKVTPLLGPLGALSRPWHNPHGLALNLDEADRVEDRCQFSLRWEGREMDSGRDREKERERELDCVTGGNIISQAALTHSVNQQRWKRTPDKYTHTHTHRAPHRRTQSHECLDTHWLVNNFTN